MFLKNNSTSRIISKRINSKSVFTQDELKNIRDDYVQHIEEPNWKEYFMMVSNIISSSLPNLGKPYSIDVFVQYQKHIYLLKGPIIVIGRKSQSDVKLDPNNDQFSRISAIIMFFQKKTVVIDVGSLYGIKTLTRSNNDQLEHSISTERKPIVFDSSESFTLKFGSDDLDKELSSCLIKPKLCGNCLTNVVNVKYTTCGHTITCLKCSKNLLCCPLCRKIITRVKEID